MDKQTYNALTELHGMLESQAWKDAAKFISSLNAETNQGLARYFTDRNLLVSLPTAVELARQQHPQLRQTLSENYASLAELRLAAAIREGDAATINLATVQFADTPAAADAHRWLGDRVLAAGQFSRAVVEYERATSIRSALTDELKPRMRLAHAMIGEDSGQPVTKAVAFGEVTMTPSEFESLVAEMRGRALVRCSLPRCRRFKFRHRPNIDRTFAAALTVRLASGRKTTSVAKSINSAFPGPIGKSRRLSRVMSCMLQIDFKSRPISCRPASGCGRAKSPRDKCSVLRNGA